MGNKESMPGHMFVQGQWEYRQGCPTVFWGPQSASCSGLATKEFHCSKGKQAVREQNCWWQLPHFISRCYGRVLKCYPVWEAVQNGVMSIGSFSWPYQGWQNLSLGSAKATGFLAVNVSGVSGQSVDCQSLLITTSLWSEFSLFRVDLKR